MHKRKGFSIYNQSLVSCELLFDKSYKCKIYDLYGFTFNTLNNVFSYK